MNEDSILFDFQFDFNSPHTPPQQPHQNNQPNPAIPTPSDSSSDDDENQPIHIIPLDDPLQIINMAQPVSGGQLSSITPYTGNQGLEGLVYAESIDRAKTQFAWTEAQACMAAISRGGNAMSNWIRGEKAAGVNYNCWNKANPDANDKNLRAPFLLRFGPSIPQAEQ